MNTVLVTNPHDLEFQDDVLKQLRTNIEGLRVVFTKKDGTDRSMLCTLAEGKIPADKQPKSEGTSGGSITGSAVRVFDIEKAEWRSFRWDSVKSIGV